MIKEDYISFETAKLLKEKGFDTQSYASIKLFCGNNRYYEVNGEWITPEEDTIIPTLQMAMKWLREKHNIHINLDIHWLYFANSKGWMYVIERILENGVEYVDCKGDESDKTFYLTYEEACEAAIKYCLENLI